MPITRKENENSLFKELGNDSEEALIQIGLVYFSSLIEASFKVCKNRTLAKEIAVDTVRSLWENRVKVSQHKNPSAWLLKTIKNKSLNELKSLRRNKKMTLEENQHIPITENIQQNLEAREFAKQVNKAIEKLAPKQKEIIRLVLDGLSRKEIAKQLNRSESTIKNQIYKVYKNLRKIMKNYPEY